MFEAGDAYKGLGKLGTQLNLNTDTVGWIQIPMPSVEEQCAIVDFLDRKTKAIDDFIQKKERLIELLQEKRLALITQAVTKGLDPTVPMKDSDIKWLGEIPAHWELAQRIDVVKGPRGAKAELVEEAIASCNRTSVCSTWSESARA